MRVIRLIPAALALFLSAGALAQAEWAEFSDRADHFTINFPGQPKVAVLPFKTAKGTSLPAHIYSAEDRRGRYLLTVVDYRNASREEIASAIAEAAAVIRTKGKSTYDAHERIGGQDSQRITVETPDGRRWSAEIALSVDHRLYITESATPLNAPPPAAFSVSLQILDDKGEPTALPNDGTGVGEAAKPGEDFYNDPKAIEAVVRGAWKELGGSCDAAYLKTGAELKSAKGTLNGLQVTLAHAGTKVDGTFVLAGGERSTIVTPMTKETLFLVSVEGGKMQLLPVGETVLGWPQTTLELCPGSRS